MKSTSEMLLIVHVPKTAGTSLRQSLERCCGLDKVVRDYGPNAEATNDIVREYLYSDKKADKEAMIRAVSEGGAKVLIGHFPLQKYAEYFHPNQVVAFVREPLERACSEFLHRAKYNSYPGTFEEFVQGKPLSNIQSRLLDGVSDQAFIGLTEQYPKSLRYLSGLYGLKLSRLKRNIDGAGGGAEYSNRLTDAQKALFYEYNQDDMDLYKRYKSRFSSLNIPPTKLKRMAGLFKAENLRRRNNKEL